MSVIEASAAGFKDMADGTVRFYFDVEPRHAGAALELFRARGTPAALAALAVGYAAVQDGAVSTNCGQIADKGGPLAKLAGRWCKEDDFVEFIRPIYDEAMGGDGTGWGDVHPDDMDGGRQQYAAHCIYLLCDVNSRRDLDHITHSAHLFHTLIREPYAKWQRERATA